jgi:hypothetical protein
MADKKPERIIAEYLASIAGKGGKAAAANMSPEERHARAKKAVAAREAKRKEDQMKKPIEQEPKGFDVFKTASAVIESTFGKSPVRTWPAKPVTQAAEPAALPKKKPAKAAGPATRQAVRKAKVTARGRKKVK